MYIFTPEESKYLATFLTEEQNFQKNVIILNDLKQKFAVYKIREKDKLYLEYLLKYFEELEEYRYCSDIMKIFELNDEIFLDNGTK